MISNRAFESYVEDSKRDNHGKTLYRKFSDYKFIYWYTF